MTLVERILSAVMEGDTGGSSLPNVLCQMCAQTLPVSGAGLALMTDDDHEGVVAATDGMAREMEDLQFTLGEGPCIDASRQGRPVLHSNLRATAPERWPGFGPAAIDIGIAAIFALPLQVGAIRLGALDLYRTSAGALTSEELGKALAFADAAVVILLQLQSQMGPGEGLHPQLADPLDHHPEIHQATGMIAVQAAVGLAEALLLLRARAFGSGRPIRKVAGDVVSRRLRFSRPDGQERDHE